MNFKIGKTEALALAVMIFALSFIVFWFVGYQPAVKETESIKAQQNEVIKKIEENKLTLQRLAELKKESAKLEASIVAILANLPTKPELPSYLVMLNEIAEKAGIKMNNFKPQAPASENNYAKIPIELSISARFNDVKELGGSLIEFLYMLENMPRLTRVESLNIVRQEGGSDLTVSIRMSTYSLVGLGAVTTQTATVTPEATQTETQTQVQGQ